MFHITPFHILHHHMQILPHSTSHYIHCHVPQHRTPHRTSCIAPHRSHFTAPHHTPSRCAFTHQIAHHTSLSTSHNSVSHHSTTFCIIPYVVSLHLKPLDTPTTTFCITVFHITQFTSYKASHHTIPQHISHLVTTMDIKHHTTTSHTAPLPHCT